MSLKCGCGENAIYAVYDDRQPHCLSCMLEAVDVPLQVLVRTLDPWEAECYKPSNTDQPEHKDAPGGNRGRRRCAITNFQGQYNTKIRRV